MTDPDAVDPDEAAELNFAIEQALRYLDELAKSKLDDNSHACVGHAAVLLREAVDPERGSHHFNSLKRSRELWLNRALESGWTPEGRKVEVPMAVARVMYAALCRSTQTEETQAAIAEYEKWTFNHLREKGTDK